MQSPERNSISDAQLDRIVYSIWDFQQALSALTFLIEDCDLAEQYSRVELRRYRCYEAQVIISFCRPFVDSRASSSLSLKRVGLRLSADEIALKTRLLHLRNKIIAHSDYEEMHYKGVTFEIPNASAQKLPLFVWDEGVQLDDTCRRQLEALLRRLMASLYNFSARLCQEDASRFEVYKVPASMPELAVRMSESE